MHYWVWFASISLKVAICFFVCVFFLPQYSSLIFFYCFSILYLVYFCSSLYYFILLLPLDFVCSYFPSFLRYKLRLFIWDLSSFLMKAFTTIYFPPSTVSCTLPFLVQCFFVFICLKIFSNILCDSSLTHWLFKNVLFNLHVYVNFPIFLLLVIFSFILSWLKKILGMISILNLLELVLWPNMWSILESILCVCLRRMCILLLLGRVFCVYLQGLNDLQCFPNLLYSYSSLVWLIHILFKVGIEISYDYCVTFYFSLSMYASYILVFCC